MARRRMALLLMAALMTPALAAAEGFAFGGRGEDALYEAVSAGDGLFAVGKTASADGDLASRKRTGETGWALRIGGDGRRMWDFCSAKSGMYVMTAPHAYKDGTFSLVLTDETKARGEWIVLNSRGRQEVRCAIPPLESICPEGKPGALLAMQATHGSTGPCLMLLIGHEDGRLCASALYPDGGIRACGAFYGDAQGVLCAGHDGGGMHAGAELGALALTRLVPGAQPMMTTIALPGEDVGLARVTDMLICSDGSAAVCAQTVTANQKGGAMLLRVSAEGEIIFAKAVDGADALTLLTETDAGFAACAGKRVLFFDEDGALLGETPAQAELLDMARTEGGVMGLTHLPERTGKQAVFAHITPGALRETPAPEPVSERAPEKDDVPAEGMPFRNGRLVFESAGMMGATVTYLSPEGAVIWRTRTPIHTAADRLIWETAEETSEGDILLTGRYETEKPEGIVVEGARALLTAEGVLREIGLTQ